MVPLEHELHVHHSRVSGSYLGMDEHDPGPEPRPFWLRFGASRLREKNRKIDFKNYIAFITFKSVCFKETAK